MLKAEGVGLAFALAVAGFGCATVVDDIEATDEALRGGACAAVRCFAPPDCGEGQHVIYTPADCCGRCVGPDVWSDRCELVLCAAVECPDGEQRVFHPGTCCGMCLPIPEGPPGDPCGTLECAADEGCCCASSSTCSYAGICPAVLCPVYE